MFSTRNTPEPAPERLDEWFKPAKRADVIRTGERDPISPLVRQLVYRRDNRTCQKCRGNPRRRTALHLDHIVPWSAGGTDRSDNLRTLCAQCNVMRSNFAGAHDHPSVPCVGICAPCLAAVNPRIAALATARHDQRFTVYCGSRSHESWAIPGWHIL